MKQHIAVVLGFCCLVTMVVWACSPQATSTCKENRDCTSNQCDPVTLRCATQITESSQESVVSDASVVADQSAQESVSTDGLGLPDNPNLEPSVGPETAAESTTEGGGSESVEKDPGETVVESPSESSQQPESSVTSGPCQGQPTPCPSGYLCRDEVSPAQCHRTCDPDAANSCPTGAVCQVLISGDGICVVAKEVQQGGNCDNNNICGKGLICLRSSENSPDGLCEVRCTVKTQSVCAGGKFCYLIHSRNGICITGQAGTKKVGEECKTTPECAAGLVCFTPLNRTARCAELCDTSIPCPTGDTCVELQNAPKGAGACLKP